jgi:hypothetical protein
MTIAKGFEEKSEVGFFNCAGCIDELLIWTHKPSEEDAKTAGVGRKNILCGRKGKFGLNCQTISDVRGRILDISNVTVEHHRIALHLKEAAFTRT